MIVGTFDPINDTKPAPSAPASTNLVPNSSGEATPLPAVADDYSVEWSTDFALSGTRSAKVTVTANSPSFPDGYVGLPEIDPAERLAVDVYVPALSPLIGLSVALFSSDTAYTGAGEATVALVEGWNTLFSIGETARTYFWIQVFDDPGEESVFYVDDWRTFTAASGASWVPSAGEPFYTAGQEWGCLDTGTFQGLDITPNDILTCVSVAGAGFSTDPDDCEWSVTQVFFDPFEAVSTRPDVGFDDADDTYSSGKPIGAGDWRLKVEALLPSPDAGLWDFAKWDEDVWGGTVWADLTPHVRGIEWSRGADQYLGRPRVGEATITLDNQDGRFSPWNTAPPAGSAAYFAPGTLIRCGVVSDTDERGDGWLPQFCVLADAWEETSDGAGADTWVTITGYETLSALSGIDDNALSGVVGGGDTPTERLKRLLNQAGWEYGRVMDAPQDTFLLQSTDMAANRLAECYLTADSCDARFRSSRKGEALLENVEYADEDRTADVWPLVDFSFEPNGSGNDLPILNFWKRGDIYFSDQWFVTYDADSLVTTNNAEHIVNDARFSRVGGTQQVHDQPASIARYGRRTLVRNDLISTNDLVVEQLAAYTTERRGLNTLRIASLTVSTSDLDNDDAYLATLAADIGVRTYVYPTSYSTAADPLVIGYIENVTHRITPRSDNTVTWQSTFGVATRTVYNLPAAQLPNNPLS